MNMTSTSIIQAFFYICKTNRKGYVRLSQQRIIEILFQYYNIDICRRTLNYHLSVLEDGNFIRRIKRHRRGENNQVLFHTSLNILKEKALRQIAQLANWLLKVGWKFRAPVVQNIISSNEEFQKEMLENYRRRFSSA